MSAPESLLIRLANLLLARRNSRWTVVVRDEPWAPLYGVGRLRRKMPPANAELMRRRSILIE